ncbi:MAG: decaprenyl-phosphate phosphoribosyltransferase [Gallionellaceae bacterium]|jgi:4-hydroxybenzoate polyprenyltransferase
MKQSVNSNMIDLLRLMRPHQWVKNTFVLTGLLFGHAWHSPNLVLHALMAFVAFCLISSTIYIINDIVDLEQDKLHPSKRKRPLPAGKISIASALRLAVILGLSGLLLGYFASVRVVVILLLYTAMNIAYSYSLKHIVILDVFIIATGFMLRILAGTLGLGIPPSQWLLLCGLMLTLFLGFSKRRAEIITLSDDKSSQRKVLEEYSPILLDNMIGITAAGLIMSYSLYTMNAETILIQGTPNLIYTVPFVIYGVFRYIYLLHHENRGTDTAKDLARDPHLLIAVSAWLLTTLLLIAH